MEFFFDSLESLESGDWQTPCFRHNVLPIAMGASLEEYERLAPTHSFIHVDQFKGPKELAEYLLELDSDDDKYNEYFQVTKTFINNMTTFLILNSCLLSLWGYPRKCSLHSAVMTDCLYYNNSPSANSESNNTHYRANICPISIIFLMMNICSGKGPESSSILGSSVGCALSYMTQRSDTTS